MFTIVVMVKIFLHLNFINCLSSVEIRGAPNTLLYVLLASADVTVVVCILFKPDLHSATIIFIAALPSFLSFFHLWTFP